MAAVEGALIDGNRAHLFLVGFMGSGKSTVAQELAGRTGRPRVDLDEEIERADGRPIAEIFSSDGEPFFRQLESAALSALTDREPSIVAIGGGAPEIWVNRRAMRRLGVVVWLDVTLAEARKRVGDGAGRPRWDSSDLLEFRSFFERRRVVYALADRRVEASERSSRDVAGDVFMLFERFFD